MKSVNLNGYKQQLSCQPGMIKMAAIAERCRKEHCLEYFFGKACHSSSNFESCHLSIILKCGHGKKGPKQTGNLR